MKKIYQTLIIIAIVITFITCKLDDSSNNNNQNNDQTKSSTYIVVYNANGGNGTMVNSTHTIGTAKNLNVNIFTNNGYTFIGWAVSSIGSVVYMDGESVIDLSSMAGDTVTLYAVWSIITIVPGSNLTEKLTWLQTNAQSDIDYTIEISADERINSTDLSYSGRTNVGIILIGTDTECIISSWPSGYLFTIKAGITLTLNDNITLQGQTGIGGNDTSLILIEEGGSLVMNKGSRIINNRFWSISSSTDGGGVSVSGTFIMNGGEISGNTTSSSWGNYSSGGGVSVSGTFIMNDGEIFDNTASSSGGDYASSSSSGGGVFVSGTFIMNGGKIFGNRASSSTSSSTYSATSSGGGVAVSGTFVMNGGEISGNLASSATGGSSYSTNSNSATSNGGGVFLSFMRFSTFTMNGGKISGNTASSSTSSSSSQVNPNSAKSYGGGVHLNNSGANGGTFTMNGGEISGNTAILNGSYSSATSFARGGGIYVPTFTTLYITNGTIYGSSEANNIKNIASSGGAAIYKTGDGSFDIAEYGSFSGNIWNKNGDLSTNNNTIKVINGILLN